MKTLVDTVLDIFASASEKDKTHLQHAAQLTRKGYYVSGTDTYRGMGAVSGINYYFDINCPKEAMHLNGPLGSTLKDAIHNAWKSACTAKKRPAGIDVKIRKEAEYTVTIICDTSDIEQYKALMAKYNGIDIKTIKERERERLSVKITIPYKIRRAPAPHPGQKTRATRTNRNQPPAPMPGTA